MTTNNEMMEIAKEVITLALTAHARALPDSIHGYCDMHSTIDPEEADDKAMELSRKVPFFKRKILDLLENNRLRKDQIDILLTKRGQNRNEFLAEIEQEYEKEKEQEDNYPR